MNKLLLLALFCCTVLAQAEEETAPLTGDPLLVGPPSDAGAPQSHWGLGVGAGWINDYPGAAQGRRRFLAVPTYKGRTITIDRQEGIKGDLIAQSRFKFSVSFSFLFPTKSKDIPVRVGMPDLDWTLQLGPELQIYLIRTPEHTMFVRLPLRFVATTDFSHRFQSREWNFAPSLRNIFHLKKGYGEIATRLELDYASEGYNDLFYQVAAEYATPTRPYFNAQQGLMETTVGVNYSYYDLFPWTFFAGANLYFLGDAKNRESTLLAKTRNASILFGMIRYF